MLSDSGSDGEEDQPPAPVDTAPAVNLSAESPGLPGLRSEAVEVSMESTPGIAQPTVNAALPPAVDGPGPSSGVAGGAVETMEMDSLNLAGPDYTQPGGGWGLMDYLFYNRSYTGGNGISNTER